MKIMSDLLDLDNASQLKERISRLESRIRQGKACIADIRMLNKAKESLDILQKHITALNLN